MYSAAKTSVLTVEGVMCCEECAKLRFHGKKHYSMGRQCLKGGLLSAHFSQSAHLLVASCKAQLQTELFSCKPIFQALVGLQRLRWSLQERQADFTGTTDAKLTATKATKTVASQCSAPQLGQVVVVLSTWSGAGSAAGMMLRSQRARRASTST